ncbi:MAG TPA: hypothetical protein VMN99_09275 [Anaerolineales bacterium]|nr:hypothetical protein [Anaerolineales bacterium]
MADHDTGVLLSFTGTVRQVGDVHAHVVGGQFLYQDIACEADE